MLNDNNEIKIEEDKTETELKNKLKKWITSSNLHFVLGAGFNNSVLPLAKDLKKTQKAIEEKIKSFILNEQPKLENDDFEEWINEILTKCNKEQAKEISQIFKKNIKEDLKLDSNETYDELLEACDDDKKLLLEEINDLFININLLNIIKNKGNGNFHLDKRTFFWTLNYDNLLNKILLKNKMPFFSIDKDGFDENALNYTIFFQNTKTYQPTYFIQKIHGTKSNPIIPGNTKYSNLILDMDLFQGYINMKNLLNNQNSQNIIFVIGYSCKDKHINEILSSSTKNGNLIFKMDFDEEIEKNVVSNLKQNLYQIKTKNVFKYLIDLFSCILNQISENEDKNE